MSWPLGHGTCTKPLDVERVQDTGTQSGHWTLGRRAGEGTDHWDGEQVLDADTWRQYYTVGHRVGPWALGRGAGAERWDLVKVLSPVQLDAQLRGVQSLSLALGEGRQQPLLVVWLQV